LTLTVCRPELDRRPTAQHALPTPPVRQHDTADSRAALWLKCTKFPRVGAGTQILSEAGLGPSIVMTRTASGGDNRDQHRKVTSQTRP